MHPLARRWARIRAAERPQKVEKVFDPATGLAYCERLPVRFLEPICPRVSRVMGDKFDRLVASIRDHGLANPLLTVSWLPEPDLDQWQEFRLRFLFKDYQAPIKIVVGHNRYAAIQQLGWDRVPVLHSGPIPKEARRQKWTKLGSCEDAQSYLRDGTLGLGPYSVVMESFTPPLVGVPPGF